MADVPARPAPSRAAIFGHPVHPALIPYPFVTLTGALATDLAGRRTGDPFWPRASRLLLRTGLASGVLAGAVGAVDYYGVDRVREHAEGRLHAYGNVAALALTALNLGLRDREDVPRRGLALSAVVAGLLGATGWLGGELSYRYKVGVMDGREAPPVGPPEAPALPEAP